MSEIKTLDYNTQQLKDAIIEGAQEKRAKDIVSLDLKNIHNSSTDYYVVCHGQSDRQSASIAKSIEETVFNRLGLKPFHREGYENGEWILLDYFDIVAHIFVEKQREFFAIEDLWADAPVEEFENMN
ncbi:MAG: ribosome silencing factor [Bacteroidia bacterium]